MIKLIDEKTEEFPKLAPRLTSCFECLLDSQYDAAIEATQTYQAAEQAMVFTANHYYMDTITKYKAVLAEAQHEVVTVDEPPQQPHVSDISAEFLKSACDKVKGGLSNDEQAILELRVSLHAYKKVKEKRLFDASSSVPLRAPVSVQSSISGDTNARWHRPRR